MWKHKRCGGQLHPLPGDDGEFCSKCGRYVCEMDDSQTYLDHYIINDDGTLLASQEANHV